MKRVLCLMLVVLLMLTNFAYAEIDTTDEESYYIKQSGSDLDRKINEANLKVMMEKLNNSIKPLGWGETLRPYITPVKQENSYYCGPANIVMALRHIKGSSGSQTYHANRMGTNPTDGTYVYKMTNEMNAQQSKFLYAHSYISSSTNFANILEGSIGVNAPVILHGNTKSLQKYNGTSIGHYLIAQTIAADGDGSKITRVIYVDPWDKDYGKGSVFGSHTDTFQNVYNAVKNRYVIWGQ